MKHYLIAIVLFFSINSAIHATDNKSLSLTVSVSDLRNSYGNVVFALYNRKDALPDEHYKKYYKIVSGKITNRSSVVVFKDLRIGQYAVNILHDENNDGKIKKKLFLPVEGIGFSNFQSIGFSNRPTFKKAAFKLRINTTISVRIIYVKFLN
jgi:uncharacterized protein (DUF2141 family)